MAEAKSGLRARFEAERRRAAFIAFLPGMGTGIIAVDSWADRALEGTWAAHSLGIPGGIAGGLLAAGLVYGYETLMWRKHHG